MSAAVACGTLRVNLYNSMGQFSRRQIGDIFHIVFFAEIRLWHFMKIVSQNCLLLLIFF